MSYKLDAEQRERANALVEQIIDDPETAAFELIWLRDNQHYSEQARELNRTEGLCPRCWDADHIIPVVEGGGECDLDNLRTLCHPCHKAVTAELAGRRAAKSNNQSIMQLEGGEG